MVSDDLYGLVLAGGRSSRMQMDKGELVYHAMPQRDFLFHELRKHCSTVYTSCFPGQNIPAALNPLEDQFDIRGPMNGILSAFKNHPDKAWLVVAVDMPNITAVVLNRFRSHCLRFGNRTHFRY
jgi:molybdenum cofactor guanylyltransferase